MSKGLRIFFWEKFVVKIFSSDKVLLQQISIQTKFLWGSVEGAKKISWISWENMCCPKSYSSWVLEILSHSMRCSSLSRDVVCSSKGVLYGVRCWSPSMVDGEILLERTLFQTLQFGGGILERYVEVMLCILGHY